MIRKIFFFLAIAYTLNAYTQTMLPSFFDDHMVLQQQTEASIWGTDNPKTRVSVTGSWGAEATARADKNGKWKVDLETPEAGGPYTLTISGSEEIILTDILIGEVWFCSGQSNMEMPVKGFNNQPVLGSNEAILNGTNDQIRMFTTERNASLESLSDVTGSWQAASPATVPDFSATAYFFGKKIQEILGIPVGLIHSSWGGSAAEAWMDEKTLAAFPELSIPEEMPESRLNRTPTLLYNAMLHPFLGYTIKGVIWYQGESNRNQAEQYKTLFPAMINSWRDQWGQGTFPFYFVQIAPYGYEGNDEAGSAFLREAQLHTMLNTENTGMAVTMDIGDCDCIHPANKEKVGHRLAYWALAKDYAIEGIGYTGPVYKKMEVAEDGKVILYFDHLGVGLSFYDNVPGGFEIAGADRKFVPAQASINRDRTLSVWSDEVPDPVAVRYAFKNCIEGTLFNTYGLPASSFRTDDWE